MKKLLLFVFFIFSSLLTSAQDFCALKQEADILKSKGKYKQAAKFYDKAIDRVVKYQDKVMSNDWIELSIAAAHNEPKFTKKTKPEYAFVKYGSDGTILKDKIGSLKDNGAKCVFTYRLFGGFTGHSYRWQSPTGLITVGRSSDRKVLVWANKGFVFMQGFDNQNVYEPIKVENKEIIDICLNHYNDLVNDKINPLKRKDSEQLRNEIAVMIGKESHSIKVFDDGDLVAPVKIERFGKPVSNDVVFKGDSILYQHNSQTMLIKLIPLLRAERLKFFPTGG
ncbi:hypothetical protein [Mucilaginibacter antarcticus]|uniref:Tetratricopeptide repeat protein n=1 Tax=Mucilaginibacter antarcticus TaxID=1855725 RepID=A0ABW5XUH0_9SPHI